MATAEEYRTASTELFDQAIVELEAGDVRQASEKLWGAAAQALKSVAERRGWKHDSHAQFYRIIRNLIDETGDKDIRPYFAAASELNQNFYENWLFEDEIRERSEDVRSLIDRLERQA